MKVRKYFRGSGRVLAFVFIASIIWLLFDMAALRLSISDVNSQLLKELIVKEREASRQQTTRSVGLANRGFKYPVQKVHIDKAVKRPYKTENNVDEIYRKRIEGPALKDSRLNARAKQIHHVQLQPELKHLNVIKRDTKDDINHVIPIGNLNMKSPVKEPTLTVSKNGNILESHLRKSFNTTFPEFKKVGPNEILKKAPLPVELSTLTKAPPGVQEDKRLIMQSEKNKADTFHNDFVRKAKENNMDYKIQKNPKDLVKSEKQKSLSKKKMVEDHSLKSVKKNRHGKSVFVSVGSKLSNVKNNNTFNAFNKSMQHPVPMSKSPKVIEVKANPTSIPKATVHLVMALDRTQNPRDPDAVGQFGLPAIVAKEKEQEVRDRWNEGHFNVYLSDQIPVDRSIPDTRPQTCSKSLVHNNLPTTSVIFCFVNEVWSTLLRSVHSVLNRSPPQLLKEIILVDDFSTKDYLKEQLDVYMSQFPKVRIVRLKERQGLIRARIAGAAIATGEVLTFLDSHIECNVGWLEPLLERVYMDRKKVACPVIEVISDTDMSYVLVDNFQRGIFKWPLVFGWSTLSEDTIKKNNLKDSDPIKCPVMAGGLFSIDKKYFYELGTYDPGLDVWGGENMEISFKIWMCGGEIEIIPCSRVGHIFRGENPYKFPKDRQKTVERNLARVAEVWLDEYKDLFYGHGYHHILDNKVDIGNLTEQIQLRKTLQCKSFQWYLQNVYPDMDAPLVKAKGLILNRGTRKCLALQTGFLSFAVCDLSKQSQHFNYTWIRQLRQQNVCIAPQSSTTSLALEKCDNTKPHLRWLHKSPNSGLEDHLIVEFSLQHLCLEAEGKSVHLTKCDTTSQFQKWQFTNYYAH